MHPNNESIVKLLEENQQLKELLKECRRRFKSYKEAESSREYILYDLEFLTTEINNAIGEKKNGTTN
jgi:cell division septum initiation protein DivIVA